MKPLQQTEEILERLAGGETLRSVCRTEGFPSIQSVLRRVLNDEPSGFAERYAHAREIGLQVMADDIQDLSDQCREGRKLKRKMMADGKVEEAVEIGDMVDRSRLQVDSRKWLLSKLVPHKYGDKITQEISGPNGKPLFDLDAAIEAFRNGQSG